MAPKEQYGYAIARLRALETQLLEDNVYQRMIDSESLEAALKVLGETSYQSEIMELGSDPDFDRAIEANLMDTYTELAKFVPQKLLELCRLIYDVHNAKVLIKSIIMVSQGKTRSYHLLSHLGNIDTDKLVTAVETENYWEIPYGLGKAIQNAHTLWEQTGNMLAVEKSLDNLYFDILRDMASQISDPMITHWIQTRIDCENLKTLLRLYRMPTELPHASTYLHHGGTIPVNRLTPLVTEPVDTWGRALGYTYIGPSLDIFQDTQSSVSAKTGSDYNSNLVKFEKNTDDLTSYALADSKYKPFEAANILRYVWAKEMEAKNLRIILVSVSNGADKDSTMELMRYVQ